MSYINNFQFNLSSDYYIDAITYRDTENVEATFCTETELTEQKALLFVLAWYILCFDKKHQGGGILTITGYDNIQLSTECKESYALNQNKLTVHEETWESGSKVDVDDIINEIVSARNKKRKADSLEVLNLSEKELITQLVKHAQYYRPSIWLSNC